MAIKNHRGDAEAKAQVSTVTIANPKDGDPFGLAIGNKSIRYTADGTDTAATVATELARLWSESTLPEFKEVTAEASGAVITLTGPPGVPFVVTATSPGDGGANEQQTITMSNTPTGGTFALSVTTDEGEEDEETQTASGLAYNISAATLQSSLEGCSNVGAGNVACTGGPFPATPIVCTFQGDLANTNIGQITANYNGLTGGDAAVSISEVQAGSAGVNKKLQINDHTAATGGTWTFKWDGNESDPLDFDCTAAEVQAEFESFVGSGNVSCVGGPLPTSIEVEFTGELAGSEIPDVRTGTISLTGGSNATGSVTETQAGQAGQNEKQIVELPETPPFEITGGRFRLGFNGSYTSYFSLPLTEDSGATGVRDAIAGLPGIGTGNVSVDGGGVGESVNLTGNGDYLEVEFIGALSNKNVPMLVMDWDGVAADGIDEGEIELLDFAVSQLGYSGGNEKQTISVSFPSTGGNFRIGFDGEETDDLSFGMTALEIKEHLEALPNIPAGSLLASGGPIESADVVIEFADKGMQSTDQPLMTIDVAGSSIYISNLQTPTEGVNEVQSLAIPEDTHDGTCALTFDSQTTGNLDHASTAAEIEAELEALSSVGDGNVSCTGGPWPTAPVYVEFVRGMKFTNQALITATDSLDNGKVTITTDTQGDANDSITVSTVTASEGPYHWDTPENWEDGSVPVNGDDVYLTSGNPLLYGLDQSAVTLASLYVKKWHRNGKVGLPEYNKLGYREYRPTHLAIGASQITIEAGSRINIDTGSTETSITVLDTDSSVEQDVTAVRLKGSNISTLLVIDGDVGVATKPGETTTIDQLIERGGSVELGKGVTISGSIDKTGGELIADEATLNGTVMLR